MFLVDDDKALGRIDKLEHVLWHLEAFKLCAMSKLQITKTDFLPEANDQLRPSDFYQITDSIAVVDERFKDKLISAKIPIYLHRSTAFGLGLHPSTKLALMAIEKHLPCRANLLDVGTGTGILAIAAAKLGVASITAIDRDADSITAASRNLELNGFGSKDPCIQLSHVSVADITAQYDFVVANLPGSTLLRYAKNIACRLAPGGLLGLSGILATGQAEIESVYKAKRLDKIDEIDDNKWKSIIYQNR
jgi:ribosomal protein L11 methyltransferase